MIQAFRVTLLDDVVISSRAATYGGHRSLDYLPGANLLGAAAARLYAQLGEEQAWSAFHSGRLRFGNALPFCGEEAGDGWAFPMPLCFHEEKGGEPAVEHGRLAAANIKNPLAGPLPEGRSYRPLGGDYLTATGRVLAEVPRLRMKTAIDTEQGRAADGQLFGYAGLPRGAVFAFTLEGDDGLEALAAAVAAALTGELRLGRSRSAEYGRVRVEPLAALPAFPSLEAQGREVTLWLLSDLAVEDDLGQPTWQPRFEWLGTGSGITGSLVPAKSFLRVRSYAPFNGHYRTRELERPVIAQGSVLTFRLDRPLDEAARRGLAAGVGLYRQAGLGRVWVDPPPLLKKPEHHFRELPAAVAETKAPAEKLPLPDHPLAQWLEARVGREEESRRAEAAAAGWIAQLPALYRSARLLQSAPRGVRVGPSPSQWGRVLEAAKRRGADAAALARLLFEERDAVCKGADWEAELHAEAAGATVHTFGRWLRALLAELGDDPLAAPVVARVARRAIDRARAEEGEPARRGEA